MIVSAVMIAFMSVATAGNVTAFNITPDWGIAGENSSYNMTMNTTGFNLLNVTIPMGFGAVAPQTGGERIAKVDFWNSSEGWLANATIKANQTDPSGKVDIEACIKLPLPPLIICTERKGVTANYGSGSTTTIDVGVSGVSINATLTLPRQTVNGSLNISFNIPVSIPKPNNVSLNIGEFVKNPDKAGDYNFTAKADSELTGKQDCVQIKTPLKINETMYKNSITQPIDVSKIHYKFTAVNEDWAAKWTNEILYVQKETKYSIAIYLNKTGYVTRVDFERWGFPIAEIPYKLAEQSLARLPPRDP